MGELQKGFGDRVRKLRAVRGLTQAELADRTGISVEWVRRIERGAAGPSFETIEALGGALAVEVSVPLGLPTDSSTEQQLVAQLKQLDQAEQKWLLGLVAELVKRPGRP